MTRYGFDLSEKFALPVMLRITTRLAHSRSAVVRSELRSENEVKLPTDLKQFILLPALARKRYKLLLSTQDQLEQESVNSGLNRTESGEDLSKGIIACGLSYNYYQEVASNAGLSYPVLKISQYPVPAGMLDEFVNMVEQVVVLEEGAPMLEESLTGILKNSYQIGGRLDGLIPRDGELDPLIVKKALGTSTDPWAYSHS